MQIIIGIIIGALIAAGSFIGGRLSKQTETVEYIDILNNAYIEQNQQANQQSLQGQVVVILESDGSTNRIVNVNLLSATNITVTFSTNTNARTSITNRRIERRPSTRANGAAQGDTSRSRQGDAALTCIGQDDAINTNGR